MSEDKYTLSKLFSQGLVFGDLLLAIERSKYEDVIRKLQFEVAFGEALKIWADEHEIDLTNWLDAADTPPTASITYTVGNSTGLESIHVGSKSFSPNALSFSDLRKAVAGLISYYY